MYAQVKFVAAKLKYHRLKRGGVWCTRVKFVAAKLKYHQLKRGGVYYFTNSRDVRTLGVYVHCIQRLAGSDEKSIAFWTAKTNVARGFR